SGLNQALSSSVSGRKGRNIIEYPWPSNWYPAGIRVGLRIRNNWFVSEGRATHNSWRCVTMNDSTTREAANDPQDLERLLVERENAGDVAGMTALFEPDAVVDIGGGTFIRGKEAIHGFFTKLQVTGFGPEKRKFEFGEQRPALICGDLALTSTRSRNGTVTSEVARRQKDGTWLWVIDRYSVSW